MKNLPAMQETWVQPWVGKILWRREWLTTPVFLPGEFHGQRCLVNYSPWGHKGLGTSEQLTLSLFICKLISYCRRSTTDRSSTLPMLDQIFSWGERANGIASTGLTWLSSPCPMHLLCTTGGSFSYLHFT